MDGLSRAVSAAVILALSAPMTAVAAAPGGADVTPAPANPSPITLVDQAPETKVFTFDYGVPTSPALQLMGLSPDKTTTSTSLKPFVIALPTFLSGAGAGQSAALDVSPLAMLRPGYTYGDYRALGPVGRAFYRTRLGLAGYRGVEDADASKSKASKVAVSLSASLLDFNDPSQTGRVGDLSFWERCTGKALANYPSPRAVAGSSTAAADQANVRFRQVDLLSRRLKAALDSHNDARAAQLVGDNAALINSVLGPDKAGPADGHADAPVATAGGDHRSLTKAEVLQWLQDQADKAPAKDATSLLVAKSIVQAANEPAAAAPAPPPATPAVAGESPADILAALQKKLPDLESQADAAVLVAKADQVKDAADAGYTKAVTGCIKKANSEALAEAALDVGAGGLWNGSPGQFDHFDRGGAAAWLGYRIPLLVRRETTGTQLGLVARDKDDRPLWALTLGGSIRYAWRDQVPTGDKTTPAFAANTLDIWTGLQWITTASKFDLQYGRYKADATGDSLSKFNRSGDRWLASAAIRLSDDKSGMWANLSYGEAHGSIKALDDKTVLVTLSYGPVDIPSLFGSK